MAPEIDDEVRRRPALRRCHQPEVLVSFMLRAVIAVPP
jgi:hypothetical protein